MPEERLLVGYFYEMNEVIYKIMATEANINLLLEKGKLSEGSVAVCQKESLDDILSEKNQDFITILVLKMMK